MLTVFGLGFAAFLFFGMLRANAYRWRYLAESYALYAGPPLAERNMRSAVLVGLGAFNSLKGIMTIGVHRNGVSFRIMPLFSLFHAPLFVPFADIDGWETTWFIDARSSELGFRRAPEVKMILPAEDAEWIRRHAGERMILRDVSPPGGNAGQGWRAAMLAHAFVSLAMIGWLLTSLVLG